MSLLLNTILIVASWIKASCLDDLEGAPAAREMPVARRGRGRRGRTIAQVPEPEPIPRRQTRASRGRGRRANEPVVPPAPEPPIPEEEEIAAAPEVPEPEPAVPGAPDEGAALSVPSSSLPDEEILAARYAQGRESFRRQVSERASSLRREIEEGTQYIPFEAGNGFSASPCLLASTLINTGYASIIAEFSRGNRRSRS
jgi:hypothetical protein